MPKFPPRPLPETEKEKITRLMAKYQEERKQLWRDSMVAILQSGVNQPLEDCAKLVDAILAEYDTRFKNVRI